MRRIRTMTGELVDRQYAVRSYAGQIVDSRKAVKLYNGEFASPDDPSVVKSYFGNYINSQIKTFISIDKGVKTTSVVSLEEVENMNSNILIQPETHGTDLIIQLDSGEFTLRSFLGELGYHYDPIAGRVTTKEFSKNNYTRDVKIFKKFNNIIEFNPDNLTRSRFFGTHSPTNLITEGNNNKFGVELETADGFLPHSAYFDLNVKCVYDGSLKDDNGNAYGGEYVTGILRGDLGFNQINKLCKELVKTCTINSKCGLHVHVNIKPSSLFIVNLYRTLLLIEDEMFSYIPQGRRNGPHSKALPELPSLKRISLNSNDSVDRDYITNFYYNWLREAVAHRSNNPGRLPNYSRHPMGDKCNYDKDTMRYCWANFVPALFLRDTYKGNPKDYDGYTIEFRSHSGTLNFNKIKNWVKLCLAIVQYVENHQDIIFMPEDYKLSVNQIIKYCYPKSKNVMATYLKERVETFSKKSGESADNALDEENSSVGRGLRKLIKI